MWYISMASLRSASVLLTAEHAVNAMAAVAASIVRFFIDAVLSLNGEIRRPRNSPTHPLPQATRCASWPQCCGGLRPVKRCRHQTRQQRSKEAGLAERGVDHCHQ